MQLAAGSTAITAYVSLLTTLQKLSLQGNPMAASAALMHLQQLTRLTSLRLSGSNYCNVNLEAHGDLHVINNSWALDCSVERCQVCLIWNCSELVAKEKHMLLICKH